VHKKTHHARSLARVFRGAFAFIRLEHASRSQLPQGWKATSRGLTSFRKKPYSTCWLAQYGYLFASRNAPNFMAVWPTWLEQSWSTLNGSVEFPPRAPPGAPVEHVSTRTHEVSCPRVCSFRFVERLATLPPMVAMRLSAAIARSSSRHLHLIRAIKLADADVMCLVECDSMFGVPASHKKGAPPLTGKGSLLRWLRAHGYDAVYRSKATGAEHGSLIAWRSSKLSLVASAGLRLDDAASAYGHRLVDASHDRDTETTDDIEEAGGVYRRGNVGVVACLASADNPSRLWVFTTCHLWWQPDEPHINVAQAVMIRTCMEDMGRAALGGRPDAEVTMVLAADTNRFPDDACMETLWNGKNIDEGDGTASEEGGVEPSVSDASERGSGFALSFQSTVEPSLPLFPWDAGLSGFLVGTSYHFGSAPPDSPASLPPAFRPLPKDFFDRDKDEVTPVATSQAVASSTRTATEEPCSPAPVAAKGKAFRRRASEWPHAESSAGIQRRVAWFHRLAHRLHAHGLIPATVPPFGSSRKEASDLVSKSIARGSPSAWRLYDSYELCSASGSWLSPLPLCLAPALANRPDLIQGAPEQVLAGFGITKVPSKTSKSWAALCEEACVVPPVRGLQLPPPLGDPDALQSHRGPLPTAEEGYFTNAVPGFRGAIDHVLVSEPLRLVDGTLQPRAGTAPTARASPLPNEDWCFGGSVGLPNTVCPSDHLPLLVELPIE
jgi:hypothetical protein